MSEEKLKPYVLSIIILNEPGALARVVGLLCGRGINIESLTVAAINTEVSRLTIVCPAAADNLQVIDSVMHQVNRIIIVRRVRDLTDDPNRVDLETTLLRVDVSNGDKRQQAFQIACDCGLIQVSQSEHSVFYAYHKPGLELLQEIIGKLTQLGNVAVARSGLVSLGGHETFREVK